MGIEGREGSIKLPAPMITEAIYGASKKEINCGGWENDGSWTKLVERKKRAFHGGGKKHEQNAFE